MSYNSVNFSDFVKGLPSASDEQKPQQKIVTESQENGVKAIPTTYFAKAEDLEKLTTINESDAEEINVGYSSWPYGSFVSNSNLRTAIFENEGYDYIEVCTGHSDANVIVIGFYQEEYGSYLLREFSVRSHNGKNQIYSANVPKEAKTISVSYRVDTYWTTDFYLKIKKNVQNYKDVEGAGFYEKNLNVEDIPFGWFIDGGNRIKSSFLITSQGKTFKAKVKNDSGVYFALRINNENKTLIFDSGWVSSIEKNIPYNGKSFDVWIKKTDNSNFSTGDENVADNYFEYATIKKLVKGSNPAGICYVEDIVEKNTIQKNIRNIAHQGFSQTDTYGRSLVSSFILASKNGFDYGECDVQWSSDGVPVCCHDETFVDGISGETITIASKTLAELKTYQYYGETIASFEEVVATCKKVGIGLYVDKTYSFYNDDVKSSVMFSIVQKYRMEKKVVWILPYTSGATTKLKLWYPNASYVFLITGKITNDHINSVNVGNNGLNYVGLDVDASKVSVDEIIETNSKMNCGGNIELWTIDSKSTYEKFKPYVSGITSNKLSEKIINE